MIGDHIGKYEIRSELGHGGMAIVYLAYDPSFRRQVAVKLLPPRFLENAILRARFEREARVIATIEHPAIVPVYDFGEQDGQLYLVMRYMAGGSLADQIKQKPVPLSKAISLIEQLGPGLDAVHDRGIVHRDLKPGNILFDAFGNPALSDFGIAQISEATIELTGDIIIGTPAYMSPEQVRGEEEIDRRSDIYALGIIFYEMLTGRQPFRAATPMSLAMKHLTEPVPQLRRLAPQFPAELDLILAKILAKEPARRYGRIADLAADLRALPEVGSRSQDSTQVDMPQAAPGAATLVEAGESPAQPLPVSPAPPPDRVITGQLGLAEASAARPVVQASGAPAAPAIARLHRPGLLLAGTGGLFALAGSCLLLLIAGLWGLRAGVFAGFFPAAAPTEVVGLTSATQGVASTTAALTIAPMTPSTASPPVVTAHPPTSDSAESSPTAGSGSGVSPSPAGAVLLEDDFSSLANGWPVLSNANVNIGYQQGVYGIAVYDVGRLYWASPDGEFSDASLSVEATKVSGSAASYFGLLCRWLDQDNFYYLIIRSDQYFTIGKYKDAQFESLLPGGWTFSEAIQPGNAANHLQADCAGDNLRFSVNAVLLSEVQDGDFSSGKLGLVAAALDETGLAVNFDRFSVRESER